MPRSGVDSPEWDARSVLAASFVSSCRAAGIAPDPHLDLVDGARTAPAVAIAGPWDLGALHEQLTAGSDRTRRGAWYTPRGLAERLVASTVDAVAPVLDPSCGGGVFLLAAAQRLVDLGAPVPEAVASVQGFDVDPLAVAVSRAALWWWSTERGAGVVPEGIVVGDALESRWPSARFVVGNPPFLGQLRRSTATPSRRRQRLQERFGHHVGAYTDLSALFVLAAVEAADVGDVITLIQPQSVLAARDSAAVRRRVEQLADLEACWFDDGTAFDAAVDVCAPRLRRRGPGPAVPIDWSGTLADHHGVPLVDLDGAIHLEQMAHVAAGFRDEYYGLVDAVAEGGPGPRLVTSGVVDPFVVRTDRTSSFAKRRWHEPRIDIAAATERAAAWVRRQAVPKVIVASQTRVVECVADTAGEYVVGVPGLVVAPHDPDDVWHIAAALSAPCVSAWLLRRSVGAGLSKDTLRTSAPLLSAVPMPLDRACWDRAATLARALHADPDPDADEWRDFAVTADAAYGVSDESVVEWWWRRAPL